MNGRSSLILSPKWMDSNQSNGKMSICNLNWSEIDDCCNINGANHSQFARNSFQSMYTYRETGKNEWIFSFTWMNLNF